MMAEQIFMEVDPNSVRKIITVEAPREVAWRVFTEQMATWWPLAVYKIGKANAVDAVIGASAAAGTSAAKMAAHATGACADLANSHENSCSRGTSMRTFSMTRD